MQISKKTKIIIVAVVGILILATVIWYILNRQNNSQSNEPAGTTQTASTTPEKTLQESLEENFKNIEPKVSNDQVPIVVAARRFSERLGSYSLNNRDVDALAEINPLVTAKGKQLVSSYYDSLSNNETFNGLSSKAMAVNNLIVNNDEASADVLLISTEFDGQGAEIRQYQNKVKLNLIKIGQDWLVDNFSW